MLAIERKNEILATLQKEQRVLVTELSQRYNVTEETIRRDLEKLEKEGFVKKTYGGAVLNSNTNLDLPLRIREKNNQEEKEKIASRVADMIEEGDSLMLDASSTSLMTVLGKRMDFVVELGGLGILNLRMIGTPCQLFYMTNCTYILCFNKCRIMYCILQYSAIK